MTGFAKTAAAAAVVPVRKRACGGCYKALIARTVDSGNEAGTIS